jgi:hypothetical protein
LFEQAAGTTAPINVPTGAQVGDMLVVGLVTSGGVSVLPSTGGWVRAPGSNNPGTSVSTYVDYLPITDGTVLASLTSSYTWTGITTGRTTGFMQIVRGADLANPFVGLSIGSNTVPTGSTVTIGSQTLGQPNVLMMAFTGGNAAVGLTWTPAPAGFTQISQSTGTGRGAVYHSDLTFAAAPVTTGTKTVTWSSVNLEMRAVMVAIQGLNTATASITALPQPDFGYVMITVNFSGDTGVTYGGAVRIEPDGTQTPVRVNTAPDPTGNFMLLNGGTAILYDTEAPMDVALTYKAVEPSGVYTATTSTITLNSEGTLWLKDPVYPAHDVRIFLDPPAGLPECNPGDGIFWRTKNGDVYTTQTNNVIVNNSSLPVPLVRKRLAAASQLSLVTRTYDDRDLLIALFAPGTILLLETPAKYGVPRRYVSLGDVQINPVSRVGSRQWSTAESPYQTVDRPAGASFGVAGARWGDLCSGPYATFGAATTAGITWAGVVSGQAGPPADLPPYRTWIVVKSTFANWNAVNTGGRTWDKLWAGQ